MTAWVLAALLSQAYYSPGEAQSLFSQANDAYDKGDYTTAREDYEKLLQHGQGGADVLYNLGTTALAAGDVGNAILYLERARKAGGRADDVEANLAVARSKQLDQVVGGTADEPFLERVVAATADGIPAWVFLGCWSGAFAFLLLRRVARGRARTSLLALAAVLLVGAVPSGALLAAHVYVGTNFVDAVVLSPTLPVRDQPKDGSKVSFEIHAGLKVRLMDEVGNYARIRLPNGLEGWAQKTGVVGI